MYTRLNLHTAANLIYCEENLSLDFQLAVKYYNEEVLIKTLKLLSSIVGNWFDDQALFANEIDEMIEAVKMIIAAEILKCPKKTHFVFLQDCLSRLFLAETTIQIARKFRAC